MPQPPISMKPVPLHRLQPPPRQNGQPRSNSAPGSTKGKNDGLNRTASRCPKKSSVNAISVALRSASVTPSSMYSPSIWWNIGLCVASSSQRNVAPGATIRIGGLRVRMVRICTGEVCVRSTISSNVFQSVSICGPSATAKPSSPKMATASIRTWVSRCRLPAAAGRPGSVTSTTRARSTARAAATSCSSLAATRASISPLTLFMASPTRGRSAGGSLPRSFMSADSAPFLPRNCAWVARMFCSSTSGAIASLNEAPTPSIWAMRSVVVVM
jgi:hypothetical protein